MSLQYNEYLKEHIQNVAKGLRWMVDNLNLIKLGISESDVSFALETAGVHDQSKYDQEEYKPYDDYFYGGNKSHAVKTAFDEAWLHHQHVNPHHWQYWVLINDDDGVKPLPMPEFFILEMIADWWTFSWRKGNLMEIFDWYDKHRDVILFEDETRKLVEKILNEMRKVLEMQKKHEDGYLGEDDKGDHLKHHGILGQKWGQRNGPPYPLNRNPLDDYSKEKITKATIDKYKDQAKQLSHVRINQNTNGTIFTNNGKLVGMINVEEKDDGHRWIQGLELFGDGKGKGLSYDFLDYATNELGATHLSVNKENSIAKHVYDKYGFQTYDETDDMYFMKFDDHLEHHGILGQKWGQRNGPPYPLKEGDHSKDEQKLQGLQNLNGAKTANMEKWGNDPDHNVLYIAGYSGSGKSTTALALKQPGDSVIHLDIYAQEVDNDEIQLWQDKDFNKYLDAHVDDWRAIQKATKNGEGVSKLHSKEYWNKVEEFDKAIDDFAKQKYKDGGRVIVEGVQIADNWLKETNDDYAGKPIIILQNGPIKSLDRAAKRDGRGNLVQALKSFDNAKEYAGVYYQMYKNLDGLANTTGAKKKAYSFDDELSHSESEDDHLEHHGILGQKWGQRNGPPYPLNSEEKLKHVNKLNDVMNSKWEYGVLHNGKHITDTEDFDWGKDYRTIPIETLEKEKIGVCWDFVNYQHNALKNMGIKDESFLLTLQKSDDPDDIVTHTFTTFDLGGKKYWIESAAWPKRGVHEINDYEDVVNELNDMYGKPGKGISVFKYNPEGMDKGLTDREFFDKATQDLIYDDGDHLEHHGILGQKWGVRRYQNTDGSLTEEGKKRYRKTVFVSGSSKTQTEDSPYYRKDLPGGIQKELDKHMEKHDRILVGDAPGIDRQVQDYLNEKNYDVVEVYGPGKQVRYSANGSWKTNPIDAPEFEEGSKDWLAKKDIAMSKEADECLAVILDEGAKATRKNVQRMRDDDKDVKVYMLNQNGLDLDRWLTQRELKDVIVHSDMKEDEHQYGVPEQKKFPLPDADHVRSAIRFFNWVDPKYEKELAKAILEKMNEYGMSFDDFGVGDENRFKKYMPEEDLKDSEEKSK